MHVVKLGVPLTKPFLPAMFKFTGNDYSSSPCPLTNTTERESLQIRQSLRGPLPANLVGRIAGSSFRNTMLVDFIMIFGWRQKMVS